jgi:hypothetical protein
VLRNLFTFTIKHGYHGFYGVIRFMATNPLHYVITLTAYGEATSSTLTLYESKLNHYVIDII